MCEYSLHKNNNKGLKNSADINQALRSKSKLCS